MCFRKHGGVLVFLLSSQTFLLGHPSDLLANVGTLGQRQQNNCLVRRPPGRFAGVCEKHTIPLKNTPFTNVFVKVKRLHMLRCVFFCLKKCLFANVCLGYTGL